ncbi:response regulator transcription factor [Nocardioides sp.]|uniref:LuxR C-terminal-related transcriptional regulator n=1 Tax=Nocardioides sp. TaxID=35761 RepID=UPI001A35C1F3|nr:response regulator transcription factor [Nocardioides sp.]MBJ7357269.1 response regulator transcription factor [Nocardioides sp.]
MTPPITVAAIDDHPVVLRGVQALLAASDPGLDVVAIVGSVDELLEGPGADAQVVLLDLGRPEARSPHDEVSDLVTETRKVLIFTSEDRPVPIAAAIQAGASGLVLKADPEESLARAIRRAVAGELVFSGPVANALVQQSDLVLTLSARQVEILELIASGVPRRSIARRLAISENTVGEYLKRIVTSYREQGVVLGNAHSIVRQAQLDGFL